MPLASSQRTVSGRWSDLRAEARYLRQTATEAVTAMLAGPVSANNVLGTCQRLQAGKQNILVPATTDAPLITYAKTELNDSNYDLAAEVATVVAAVDQVIAWVVANFPTAGGYIQKDKLNADGSVTVRQFSTVQTAGLRTRLTTLAGVIADPMGA